MIFNKEFNKELTEQFEEVNKTTLLDLEKERKEINNKIKDVKEKISFYQKHLNNYQEELNTLMEKEIKTKDLILLLNSNKEQRIKDYILNKQRIIKSIPQKSRFSSSIEEKVMSDVALSLYPYYNKSNLLNKDNNLNSFVSQDMELLSDFNIKNIYSRNIFNNTNIFNDTFYSIEEKNLSSFISDSFLLKKKEEIMTITLTKDTESYEIAFDVEKEKNNNYNFKILFNEQKSVALLYKQGERIWSVIRINKNEMPVYSFSSILYILMKTKIYFIPVIIKNY